MTGLSIGERPFAPYPFEFVDRASQSIGAKRQPAPDGNSAASANVVIVGGGISGLSCALALASQKVPSIVLEADDTVCYGSRATCISRRSLEIFDRCGVADAVVATSLPWTGGRSYYRNREVLHFLMPTDGDQKFAPMVNIQQYRLEEILVQAIERVPEWIDLRWGTRLEALSTEPEGVVLEVASSRGRSTLRADWLVACDGGRSLVREALQLPLLGTSYEGRYVIVDILMKSKHPTERRAWFDPESNPGSTILMHKQPDDLWRVDYQLKSEQDEVEAVKPENVLPLVEAHLRMIGETGAWSPVWISLYKAKALSLERYRHGRVMFCGDAAHLVPIFGVRGANSAIDDADNLAWKLAAVINQAASDALLDSYSEERRYATHVNLDYGAKSTEFMAPPSAAFEVMRDAVLNLAVDRPEIRSLINPRQTSVIYYRDSPLNSRSSEEQAFTAGPRPGENLPCMPLSLFEAGRATRAIHLADVLQAGKFLLLCFGSHANQAHAIADVDHRLPLRVVTVVRARSTDPARPDLVDDSGRVFGRFDAREGASYLIRPDGHVLGRWRVFDARRIGEELMIVAGDAVKEGQPA
jgi:3-(3-hydroxy-phenyl)propionate hydroxylase